MNFFKRAISITIYFIVGVVVLSFGYPLIEGRRLSLLSIVAISIVWSLIVYLIVFVAEKISSKKYPMIKVKGKNTDDIIELILSDGKVDIPCTHIKQGIYEIEYQIGCTVTSFIEIRNAEGIAKTLDKDHSILKSFSEEKYNICGNVIDVKTSTVKCGKFTFVVDRMLPQGIEIGDYVIIKADTFLV